MSYVCVILPLRELFRFSIFEVHGLTTALLVLFSDLTSSEGAFGSFNYTLRFGT